MCQSYEEADEARELDRLLFAIQIERVPASAFQTSTIDTASMPITPRMGNDMLYRNSIPPLLGINRNKECGAG